jgi:dinuclear metal center YbgI/SA1388 family protein
MLLQQITQAIEAFAPLQYQESYDNSGLQIGDATQEINAALLTVDVTEAVVDEAITRGCNLIISHHPVIFGGIKKITGSSYVERIVQKAIKHDIALYAAHTNIDNVRYGVNARICQKLGLHDTAILSVSKNSLSKLYTYAPRDAAEGVRHALFAAGAGNIGKYAECSFNTSGTGTFKPDEEANPTIGSAGGPREWVDEVKIEVLVPKHRERQVLKALLAHHPYEEVAYELIALQNANQEIGAGMVGTLPDAMTETAFLAFLKERMQTACVRHTHLPGKPVQKVAVCGGAGSFLLNDAIGAGADVLVTGDFKYHQFFDAEGKIVIADIGHYESEQFTVELFQEILNKEMPNFATLLSNLSTNPVKYFY